jgi:hypothetical protein
MSKDKPNSLNGKNRRSGAERRKAERRDPDRDSETGALTTRKRERRQKVRRKNSVK